METRMNFLRAIFKFITCKKKQVPTVPVKKEIRQELQVSKEPKIECCNKVEVPVITLPNSLSVELTIDSKPIDSREIELEMPSGLSNDCSTNNEPENSLNLESIPLPPVRDDILGADKTLPSSIEQVQRKNVPAKKKSKSTIKKKAKKPAKKVNKKRGKKS